MSGIRISGLVKRFGSVVAVNNVSLEIGEGEFVSLLGPSGCGKTTILRCLAGLETPDAGVIQIGDDVVFSADTGINIPPGKRGLGMVFQSYALWPHMSVFNNVSFGLELMGIPREKRAQIVADALNLVGIGELAHRYPSELSGGQQQRVALARAVVTQPKILLLDEPLSNLDAKLRMQMRAELQRLHRKLKCTVVYVTHDQLEAMTLSTKIVLLKDGVLQQYDEPHRIYEEPVNCWVADFVGNPVINRLAGTVLPNGLVQLDCGPSIRLSSHKLDAQQRIQIGLRPEEIQLREDGSGIILKGTVHSVQPAGGETYVQVKIGTDVITVKVFGKALFELEEEVTVCIDEDKILVFDENEIRIERKQQISA